MNGETGIGRVGGIPIWAERLGVMLLTLAVWVLLAWAYVATLSDLLGYAVIWFVLFSVPCGVVQGLYKAFRRKRWTWMGVIALLAIADLLYLAVVILVKSTPWSEALKLTGLVLKLGVFQAAQALMADWMVNLALGRGRAGTGGVQP